MTGSRRTIAVVASAAGLVLLLAACANKTNAGSGNTTGSTGSSGSVTVKAMTVGLLGNALVDGNNRTLYMLTADQGGKVTCTSSACTTTWPPLLVPAGGTAVAGSGITASKLGTADTPSGQKQVTYNNWPVYMYSGDSASGQANGQGIQSFGGTWHPLAPSGQPIVGGPSSAPSSSATSPYGY